MLKHFSVEELQVLAHDLSVDWDSLPGAAKPKKTLELISYLARHDKLSSLTALLRSSRPRVNWPGLPAGAVVKVEFDYSVEGMSERGEASLQGRASLSWELEADDYFDEGMAASEAAASTASHFYVFELEKKGAFNLKDITISIKNLAWDWNVRD